MIWLVVKFFITNVMEMSMTEPWNPLILGYELAQISLFFSEHVYICVIFYMYDIYVYISYTCKHIYMPMHTTHTHICICIYNVYD